MSSWHEVNQHVDISICNQQCFLWRPLSGEQKVFCSCYYLVCRPVHLHGLFPPRIVPWSCIPPVFEDADLPPAILVTILSFCPWSGPMAESCFAILLMRQWVRFQRTDFLYLTPLEAVLLVKRLMIPSLQQMNDYKLSIELRGVSNIPRDHKVHATDT